MSNALLELLEVSHVSLLFGGVVLGASLGELLNLEAIVALLEIFKLSV